MSNVEPGETQVYLISPERPEAAVDVVFIHGLGGDMLETWAHDKHDEETFWPRWIAKDIPDAQVWGAQYPSAPTRWLGESLPLLTVVFALLDRFSQIKLGDRPIILICHSLGGLVAKQLVRAAAERTASESWRKIGSAVSGVVFIATPHSGANLATFLTSLVEALWLLRLIARPTQSLGDLRADSPLLNQLSSWYRVAAVEDDIATVVYYETKPVKGSVMVVPPGSADPAIPKVTPIPLVLDHFQTCKPRDRYSQVYGGVVQFIRDVMSRQRKRKGGGVDGDGPSVIENRRDPALQLTLIAPSNGKCTIPGARDMIKDVRERLEEAVAASGLPSAEWARKSLARYYELARANVKECETNAFTLHHGVDVTERESYALAVLEWQRITATNLTIDHRNETSVARTVMVVFEVENKGRAPAKNIEIELHISSPHRIGAYFENDSSDMPIGLPVAPADLDVVAGKPNPNALNAARRRWYDDQYQRANIPSPSYDIKLVDVTPAGARPEQTFAARSFDLRHGKSLRISPLYVTFGYEAAGDLEIAYQIFADNQPEVTKGIMRVSVKDQP